VLVLCDPRLLGKSYGRLFLDSLPPLPRTRHLGDVQRFFGLEALAAEPEVDTHDEDDDVYSWRRELEAAR
jgi:ATP-dependent DNA helicase DinG